MTHVPEIGTLLRSDDGQALVVAEGTDPVEALLDLIEEDFGGGRFSASNPALADTISRGLKVEAWRDCSDDQMRDEYDQDPEDVLGWWAPNGDGKNMIHVLSIDTSGYYLGERCEEADRAEEATPISGDSDHD